jgi:hypothetical protein
MTDSISPLWQVIATVVEAAATLVLAFFAGLQLWRERRRTQERQKSADARINGIAYLLRRQLRSWLGIEPANADGLEGWVADSITAKALTKHLDTAEERATALVTLAPEASVAIANELHEAFVLFLAATNRINQRASTPRPSGAEELDWIQLIPDAAKDLRECLEALESGPVAVEMLNAETILRRTREAENPISQLAEAIAQHRPLEDATGGERPGPSGAA